MCETHNSTKYLQIKIKKIGPKRATIGTGLSHTLVCLQMGAASGKVAHVNLSKLTPTTWTNLIWFYEKISHGNNFALNFALITRLPVKIQFSLLVILIKKTCELRRNIR